MKNDDTQQLITKMQTIGISESDLISLLDDPRLIVRANAILLLSRQSPKNETEVVHGLLQSLIGKNAEQRIVGTLTQKLLVTIALIKIGTKTATAAAEQLKTVLSREQRDDLDWHLKRNVTF